MPNAASLDADHGFQIPARRKPARAAPRKKGRKSLPSRRGAIFAGVPRYSAIAISALIGIGIVVNALMMQHGHHPAPLFGAVRAMPAKPATTPPDAGRIEATSPAPAPAVTAAAPPAAAAVTPVRTPRSAKAAHADDKMPRGDDPIARLIGGAAPHGAKVAAEKAGSKTARVAPDKRRKSDD